MPAAWQVRCETPDAKVLTYPELLDQTMNDTLPTSDPSASRPGRQREQSR